MNDNSGSAHDSGQRILSQKHYDTSPESDANNIFHLLCNPDLIVVCISDPIVQENRNKILPVWKFEMKWQLNFGYKRFPPS